MAKDNHIVKRGGHTEPYDERKLYAAVYSACQSVRETQATSEMIASQVCKEIGEWLNNKHEVTSHDIRMHTALHLQAYNEDASWILKHHRNIG